MAITLIQIVDAVADTLGAAVTVQRTESAASGELTEGISRPDIPMLQVWWSRSEPVDIPSGTTDRSTFGGKGGDEKTPIRQKQYIIIADYYAAVRAHLGQDERVLIQGVDALEDILEAQNVKPYFGLDGIKAFNWFPERANFVYGDPQLTYVGARFTLTIRVF